MQDDRWPSERDPTILGVPVHGPAVVAGSPGIAIAVRGIFARPGGLELDLVLGAVGIQAEAAQRQSSGESAIPSRAARRPWDGGSELDLVVELDGRRALVHLFEQTTSAGADEFASELRVGVAGLPLDRLVTLTASWPRAGLSEGTVTLALASLDDLERRVVRVPA